MYVYVRITVCRCQMAKYVIVMNENANERRSRHSLTSFNADKKRPQALM